MAKKKQITVTLPNKVEELARLTKSLAKNKVNIEAISVTNLLDLGIVRIVPSNIKNAKKALNNYGSITVEDVVAVIMPNDVGALSDAADKLQKQKINVDYVYGSVSASGEGQEVCIFKTSDLDQTDKTLSS